MIRKGLTSWVAKAVGSTLVAFLCLTFIIAGAAALITKIDQWGKHHSHPVLQAFCVGTLVAFGCALVFGVGFTLFKKAEQDW